MSSHQNSTSVGGASHNVEGTSPNVKGTSPNVEGTSPSTEGTSPNVEETSPNVEGTLPNAEGTSHNIEGNSHKDGGTPATEKKQACVSEYHVVDFDQVTDKDIIIALMGPTGAGKSSFIANVAMQEGEGVGHDLTSCTSEIKATKLKLEEDSVVLVDTPGIDDTNKSDMHILKLISDWLKAEYPTPQPILSAILYFHRISDNRMAGTPLKNLRFFEKLCGKNAMSKVTLVTTMWDEVDTEVGTERLKELKEVHWKTMVSRGSMIFECEDARGSPMKLLHQIVQRKKEQEWMGENEGDDSPPEGPNSSPCMRRSDGICGGDAAVTGGARATDTIIALMGPTGAGKSSFVANVTKQEGKGVGHDLTSRTSEIKVTKCNVEGFSIVLVDTPGVDNINKSDMHILKLISDWLTAEYRTCPPVLSAILYFHRISDNRMAGTPLKNLRFFERLCGENATSKVTLVTTMWDEVDSEVGKERLKELKKSYWQGMVSRGSTTFECEDPQGSPMKLLQQIVQRMKEQELRGGNEGNVLLQDISTMSWSYWKQLRGSSCVVA
ncbi:P-loop containing nucleoside triphosphate hydrolase protein [Pisolithus croceorrhizus]|nr:P-loop containing nucleoside triphosphate hydrolase protein [Pisolithus croceorrhizus]KAI6156295.1 P-loop containing nucleoside triphosphate hydrolase protein [Pisolithus thermaeus]